MHSYRFLCAYKYIFGLFLLITVAVLVSCSRSSQTGTVTTSISDPATCGSPQGLYRHIYVTVSDVQISQSTSNGNSGWRDLAPDLQNNPLQVDLLGTANQCFLATLGTTGIPVGSYEQIRVILANNGVSVNNNKCGTAANCLMLTSDPSNTPIPLQLSSESHTGIKISSGQIAGGQFVVKAGGTNDLNIDFDACASIVVEGNGQYRLKPVLHAGEIDAQSNATAITGTVVDASGAPIVGGNTVVALEQNDGTGLDRVIMEAVPASSGAFSFCPIPAGTYDVVVSTVDGNGVVYAATVITGVKATDALGNVPVIAAGNPATIMGQITTTTGSTGTAADLQVAAMQSITVNNLPVLVTIPLAQQSAATLGLTTVSGSSCPRGTDCASYTFYMAAATPSIGAFVSGQNQTPAPPTLGSANFTVDATAFIPGSAGQPDCSQPELQTSQTLGGAPLTVIPGVSLTAQKLAFTGCQ